MLPRAQFYIGQSWIGTNDSDRGQCVGLENQLWIDVYGIRYPLQGAITAKQLLTCTNTRPDLFQQVKNNPNDPNQNPSIGDTFVMGNPWGGWNSYVKDYNGHTGTIESINLGAGTFVGISQNYTPNKVTRNTYKLAELAGWIHNLTGGTGMAEKINGDTSRILQHGILGRNGLSGRPNALDGSTGEPWVGSELTNAMVQAIFLSQEAKDWRDSPASRTDSINGINERLASIPGKDSQISTLTNQNQVLADQNTALNTQIVELTNQVTSLKTSNETLVKENIELHKKVKELEAQIAANPGNININFNFFGSILWVIIKLIGIKKG